ncbi:MAG: Gldg family protein [Victivallales bacterium]
MNKRSRSLIFSVIGIAALFLIFAGVNFIVSNFNLRADLTEEKLFTLSSSTKNIIKKLDTPVTIKFYYTKSSNMPGYLKSYASKILDLLKEYKHLGGNKIIIEKYDPVPDSEAEDAALMDGISGQPLNTGDKIYLGIAVQVLDQTVALPFLSPEREQLLEYDLTRAVSQISKAKKSVIGLMSALPVMGQKPNAMMMQMGQFNQQPPWIAFKELQNDYELREIPMIAEKIDPSIELLVIVHPAGISEKNQYAIDQYILNGGKVLAFLDPNSFYASAISKNDKKQPAPLTSSNLDKLLKAWGIEYNQDLVVADMTYGRRIVTQEKKLTFPTVIDILSGGINKEEVFTTRLDNITEVFGGAFRGEPASGLKKTVLMKSTKDSHLTNSYVASDPVACVKEFKPDDMEYALAIRLSGKFKTAFPDGKPADKNPVTGEKKQETPESSSNSLKESQKESVVVLVGDSDMLYDEICVRSTNILGQVITQPLNDNLPLFQNLVGFLTGDSDLIQIRSRKVISRPFTVVKSIQSQAEQKYKNKLLELEDDLTKAQERLTKLQEQKTKNQKLILSPEQKEEIKVFRQKEAKAKIELKNLRKELRQDIDTLETRLKWINIGLMPATVILFGLGLAIYRNRRSFVK